MFKKLVSMLLILCMTISLLSVQQLQPVMAQGVEEIEVFSEDFEDMEVGDSPSDWTCNDSVGDRTVVEAVDSTGTTGKVFKTVRTGSSSFVVEKEITTTSGILTVSTEIYANQTDAQSYFGIRSIETGTKINIADISLFFDGNIKISNGDSTWTALQTYQKNKWYEIKVVLDTYKQTYKVYIDGVLKTTRNFLNNVNSIGMIETGVSRWGSKGTFFYDNIKVIKHPEIPVTSVSLDKTSMMVNVNSTETLTATIVPEMAINKEVTWTSDNSEIAEVDVNGKVTGKSVGSAIITATTDDGSYRATCAVTVPSVQVEGINLNKEKINLWMNESETLIATLEPENATNKAITWESINPEIAAVDKNGTVKGIASGTTTISAITVDGSFKAVCDVVVEEKPTQAVYYVSTDGNDNNSGTKEEPFKTLEKARDTIQSMNSDMAGDIIVYLREGTYTIKNTIAFTKTDSGTNGYNIVYKAYEDEKPVLDGGIRISGWTLHDPANNIYKASVGQPIETRQLYVNDERATRARSHVGFSNSTYNANGHTTTDTFLVDWKNISDMEIVYKDKWTTPRCGIESITSDGDIATVTMKQPGWYYCRNKGMSSATNPWYYENAYELMDSEGEWYLDRTGVIDGTPYTFYYKPKAGEDMKTAEVVAPELEKFITVKASTIDSPVHNIQFAGITFKHATYLRPSGNDGYADAQNAVLREKDEYGSDRENEHIADAAVELKYAKSILFERCNFLKLGGNGLDMYEGCQDNLIRGCVFFDISGVGIQIGNYAYFKEEGSENYRLQTDERYYMRNNDVIDNYVGYAAREFFSASGIAASFPRDMDIIHNEIDHINYSGIHVGWGWTFENCIQKGVKIQDNYIHDTMLTMTDGGAIYTLGNQGSSIEKGIVSGNYIKNNIGGYGSLYFDECSSWYEAKNNVVDNGYRYTHMWTNTIHDNSIDYTYTNTPEKLNNGTRCEITNTILVDGDNWPQKAVDIMQHAGLEIDYQDIKSIVVEGMASAEEVAATITSITQPQKDDTNLVFPEVPVGFTVAVKSSSNEGIVALDGSITLPDVETTVTLKLGVSRIFDGTKAVTQDIDVVVPAQTIHSVLGKIEAENFGKMEGVQVEDCAEGGKNLGYLNDGDWMEYRVNVSKSGMYNIKYRVAGTSSGEVEFQVGDTIKAKTTLPATGGWQIWNDVEDVVNLDEGIQTVRLYVSKAGWNFNWFELIPSELFTAKEVADEITSITSPQKDDSILVMPEVIEGFTVAISSSSNENVIGLDGTIMPVDIDTMVTIVLEVTRVDGDKAVTRSIDVLVPAKTKSVYIVNDNFDQDVIGNAPEKWTMNISGGTIKVEEDLNSEDKCVKVNKAESLNDAKAIKDFNPINGIVMIQAKIKTDESSRWKGFYVYDNTDSNNELQATGVALDNGSIKIRDGSAWKSVQSFTPGEWYDVKFALNTETQKFDFYINGILKVSQADFRTPAQCINEIQFGITYPHQGTLYVDDVKVLVPAPPIVLEPFTITSSSNSLDRTAGIKATVNVNTTQGTDEHEGNEVVIFQLMNGTTPVNIIALENDIQSEETMSAYFNVSDADNEEYNVQVFIFDQFNNDTTVPENLAIPLTLN